MFFILQCARSRFLILNAKPHLVSQLPKPICYLATTGPMDEDKSGSKWGAEQLKKYGFHKVSIPCDIQDFPWRELFEVQEGDPIQEIVPLLYKRFGRDAELGASSRAQTFFDNLGRLTTRRSGFTTQHISETRSNEVEGSSSPFEHRRTPLQDRSPPPAIGGMQQSPLEMMTRQLTLAPREGSVQATPTRVSNSGIWIPGAALDETSFTDTTLDATSFLEDSELELPTLRTPLQVSSSSIRYTQRANLGSISNTNFPSSESDSLYMGSPTMLSSSPPLLVKGPYQDQSEDVTNSMMHALLQEITLVISQHHPAPLFEKYQLEADATVTALKIPNGRGGFVNTTPDRTVNLVSREHKKGRVILDYEVRIFS